jgi:hypothetical protein
LKRLKRCPVSVMDDILYERKPKVKEIAEWANVIEGRCIEGVSEVLNRV